MKDIEWWYDQTIWPGPPDQAYRLSWDDPMADPLSSVRSFGTALLDAYKPLIEAFKKLEKQNVGAGRINNYGPRAKTTFDSRGRRKY